MYKPFFEALFDDHPDPMWVYDTSTLTFLTVNRAAEEHYGYSRAEFLGMTLRDIRPGEDLDRLQRVLDSYDGQPAASGVWRHQRKDGSIIHVDIRTRPVEFEGYSAKLVSARDVTAQQELEAERARLARLETESRAVAEASARYFLALFEALPGKFLVLTPGTYEITAVSDAYLAATMTQRDHIKGRLLFDVFPDDPNETEGSATRVLRQSLANVEATGLAQVMAVQRYPIPRRHDDGGGFEERFWSVVNTPVKGLDGRLICIVHRAEDVTEYVLKASDRARQIADDRGAQLELEILLRSKELGEANHKLLQQQVLFRNAKRLISMGTWELQLETEVLSWSENLHEMFGIPASQFGKSVDAFFATVHPDDLAELQRLQQLAIEARTPFDVVHRIVCPDGSIRIVREVAEVLEMPYGTVLAGVVQDITDQRMAEARLLEADSLLRIAGKAAKLGGWRVDLAAGNVHWSAETALIHGMPPGYSPTFAEAIGFYAPEHRDRIARVFNACASTGTSFDELLFLEVKSGRRIWVRSIGEAQRDAAGNIIAVHGSFQDVSELIEAREASQKLARRLQDTLENISDAFFLLDHEWCFQFINEEFFRIIPGERHDLLQRNIWDCFPQARGSLFQSMYEQAWATGKKVSFVEHYKPLEKWLRVNAYPGPQGLAVYFNDITEEMARDQQLLLLETAVNRQNDILLITEAEPINAPHGPRIVYVNDAFERHTGYTREDVIGKTPRILQGPGTQRAELDRIRAAVERWQPVRAELLNYTKAGEELWLELDIMPLANEKGWFTHWVSIERNITERKRKDEALRISDERFARVAKATNDVVWDWDLVNDTIWWNDSFETLTGYEAAQLGDSPSVWTDHIYKDDKKRVIDGIMDLIKGDANHWRDEYRFVCANGDPITVIDRAFVIRDAQGKAIRMIGSMVDVTENRELSQKLAQTQKLESLGQLTGGVAHDFNNLLTVILGNAELLVEELDAHPPLRQLAQIMSRAAERGAELTSRLLAFARRQVLEPKTIEINKLVTGMEGLLRRTLSEDISIEIDCASDVWLVEVDPGQLEVALLNLAINARDAMPQGGSLTLETANARLDEDYVLSNPDVKAGNYVMLSVTDSGTGMSPEVLAHAFEPFFTTKVAGKGSGLGLSMVYGFLKQSGGHARIYTELGEGTTIRLYLPQASQTAAGADSEGSATTALRGGHEVILLVEDDGHVREHVCSLLKGFGYKVVCAENGAKALELLESPLHVDLLFTDVVMPGGISGKQLADRAAQLRPGLRVLFTSGYTQNSIVHHGRLDPGVELLSKPYRKHQLAAKVRKVLDG